MEALIVIDMQKAMFEKNEFIKEKNNIMNLILYFKRRNSPIIFIKQLSDDEDDIFYKESVYSEIIDDFREYADYIVEKETPDSFFNTELDALLEKLNVKKIFISGFNTEYCCLFTAISGFSRGYEVVFMEDATGSTCDAETYEMEGLDIPDFIGSILNWSNVIEVLYCDELDLSGGKKS